MNAMKRTVEIDSGEADRRVREALQEEGLGMLTEIDVQAMLKQNLDADFRRYEIFEACDPPLALEGRSNLVRVPDRVEDGS